MAWWSKFFPRRIRFKQQMSDTDCGAACLAMILSFHGRETSVDSARRTCEVHGPPQSSRSIALAARSLGLRADLFTAEIAGLKAVSSPCILYWNFTHFVVFVRENSRGFEIVDPALGRRTVTREEFDISYTGIGIQFARGPDFVPRTHDRNQRFREYLVDALGRKVIMRTAAIVLACSVMLQIASLALPLATIYLFDQIVPAGLSETLWPLFLAVALLAANIGATAYLRARMIAHLQMTIDKSLLDGFMERLLRLPVGFFLERSAGDLQSRLNATTLIKDWMSTFTLSSILDLFTTITYAVVIALVSPGFALVTLLMGMAQFIVYPFVSSSMLEKASAEMRTQGSYQSYLLEVLNGVVTIKGSAAEEQTKKVWNIKLNNYLVSSKKKATLEALISAINSAVVVVTPVTLLLFSVAEYFRGGLSLGAVISLNAMAGMALVPLSSLMRMLRYTHVFKAHFERLGDLWRHELEVSGSEKLPESCSGLSVVFKDVSFRYQSSRVDAIKNIDAEVPLRGRVGIVGPSGSGKTTFISLLLGFHAPTGGSVKIGDRVLTEYNLGDWRQRIGYVLQNTFVFNSSIRNNIAIANPSASLEEIQRAARCAGLDADIQAMPMKYNTVVGESGVSLSGGQRQRLSIARAVVKNPMLLILDEATSNLDSVTEEVVSKNIRELECAQVLVSHRLSTLRGCNRILVFENGRLVASGTHEELMQASEFYRACVDHQHDRARERIRSERGMSPATTEYAAKSGVA